MAINGFTKGKPPFAAPKNGETGFGGSKLFCDVIRRRGFTAKAADCIILTASIWFAACEAGENPAVKLGRT